MLKVQTQTSFADPECEAVIMPDKSFQMHGLMGVGMWFQAAAIWLTGQGNLQREVERWKAAQQAAAQKQVAAERAERAARKALLNR